MAQDSGLVINPQAVKHGELKFDASNVTTDGSSYPLLRMDGTPKVNAVLVPNPQTVPAGTGEPAVNVLPGAVSNAIFDATGVRLRTIPFTESELNAAMQ